MLLCFFILVVQLVIGAQSHGRLRDPPARSTCWREFPGKCIAEYTDTQMNCGGFDTQWNKNKGKCSVCGEDWSLARKDFSKGGPKYTGYIVRKYAHGQVIDVQVEVTANHLGWFEFRVCNLDGRNDDGDEACLQQTVLKDRSGKSRFNIGTYVGFVNYQLVLPKGLQCKHCLLQWKWHCGNNWGTNPVTGQSGVGFAPQQEQFYGCADISIGSSSGQSTAKPVTAKPSTAKPATAKPSTAKPATAKPTSKPNNGNQGFPCTRGDGLYANTASGCTKYYQCEHSGTQLAKVHHFSCPPTLLFDSKLSVCNHANQVKC